VFLGGGGGIGMPSFIVSLTVSQAVYSFFFFFLVFSFLVLGSNTGPRELGKRSFPARALNSWRTMSCLTVQLQASLSEAVVVT
jgi:hypothetical protein